MVERMETQNMFGMKEIRKKAEEKTNIDLEDSFGVLSIISKVWGFCLYFLFVF